MPQNKIAFRLSVLVLIGIFLLFLQVLAKNSYGTGDVRLWLSWVQTFTISGLWPNYHTLSDYPVFATLFIYLSGVVTKNVFGVITSYSFPGVLKTFLLPFLFICFLVIKYMTKPEAKNKLTIPLIFMLFVNPAIILNTVILGYLDVLFIACLLICIYMLYRAESQKITSFQEPFVFYVLLVIGLSIKPQWFMFFPILTTIGTYMFLVRGLHKYVLLGFGTGLALTVLTVALGVHSFEELLSRLYWVKYSSYDTIAWQTFVVANFPNFWHGINFIVHVCQVNCSVEKIALGFFQPLGYWQDRQIANMGKLLFLSMSSFYASILLYKIIHLKLLTIKYGATKLVVMLAIWINIIYSYFNTSVHENHLIASVFLSVLLFALQPTRKNFLLYAFFTIINFLNLFYFYGFGISGLFGRYFYLSLFGLNTSLLLVIIYSLYIARATYCLITNGKTNLGLTL